MTKTKRDDAHQLCLFQDTPPVPETKAPHDVNLTAPASPPDDSKLDCQRRSESQAYEQRIFHLEQALDQALNYLTELGTQVKDQRLLEEKLASTEDYAFVQYQAIAHFQDHLSQYKDKLSQTHRTMAGLEADNTATQTKLLAIQQNRLALRQENAQWQHACQELQQECDRQHRKITALEQENTTMQEQILQQARQSNEYETAVQYWKDQCQLTQEHLHHVLNAVEHQLVQYERGEQLDVAEIRQAMQSYAAKQSQTEDPERLKAPTVLSTSPLNMFKVPDFLIRRYQNRSNQDHSNQDH